MPRPRKPTELLELSGAFDINPQRARPVGAKADRSLGDAPANLTEAEAEVWRELVSNAPGGVLTSAERPLVEMTARILARSRVEWPGGSTWSCLLSCLVRLGWTPSDRSKVAGTKEEAPASAWDTIGQKGEKAAVSAVRGMLDDDRWN